MKLAIIGTAGRNPPYIMNIDTWNWLVDKARSVVPPGTTLVSGGAAWADHIAVALYLQGHAGALELHLPAPIENGRFVGGNMSAGSAATYYHRRFSGVLGRDTIQEIVQAASTENCTGTVQPVRPGFGAMFARNQLVAGSLDPTRDGMLAFTFGDGDQPADGGTKHTWDLFHSPRKAHFTIPRFA
jgi:hypothetical protein